MNPTQLLAHFDRISNVPDAVPRLRRFVLDLAVRGKLVEQHPRDEPASELLKRIRTEKARLAKEGQLRKEKPTPPLDQDDFPFSIPRIWHWSQLAEIGFLSPRNSATDELPASFVPMPLISAEYGAANKHEVRLWGNIKSGYTHFAEGDVALAKITPCFENGKSTVLRGLTGGIGAGTTELHVIRPVAVCADYVLIFLKSPHFIQAGIPKMTGTAGQKRVPFEYFAHTPFPLPPLAEQHRIVAKVDELMALCDRLEAAQTERERRRDRLVAASLHRVNNGADARAFREHARFHLRHLPRLTTRREHIQQLRQTILNLAVRGRLVPQQPNEEIPAKLLEEIESERQHLSVPSPLNGFDDRLYWDLLSGLVLPSRWINAPLAKVALAIVDCPHSTPKWTTQGKMCVRTNQFRPGFLDLSDVRFVDEASYQERIQRLRPEAGDILYSREGGVLGIACRVPPNIELCLGQRMMLIRSPSVVASAFLEMVLISPLITEIARGRTTGGAAPRVNVSTIKAYPVPIPPLAEQHRIVAKVDELMALCDRLEAQLTTAQNENRLLLEAVLHRPWPPLRDAMYYPGGGGRESNPPATLRPPTRF